MTLSSLCFLVSQTGRLLSEVSAPVTQCSVNDSYDSNVNCYSILQFSCKLPLCHGSTVNGYSVLWFICNISLFIMTAVQL